MAVYSLVFGQLMPSAKADYPFVLFAGLLPWIYFGTSVGGGSSSVSDRRDLLTKVRFPAQVLPATVVLTNFVNYLLSLPLMVALGLFFGVVPSWHFLLFPAVALVQLVFTLGLVYLTSAVNVVFRDLQQILANVIMVWFFLTPVLYPATAIPEAARSAALYANPMAVLVTSYQDLFYQHRVPPLAPLALLLAGSLALMWMASV